MSAVDLTRCRRGDLLTLRDGRSAVFLAQFSGTPYPILIHVEESGIECVQSSGAVYSRHEPNRRDVVAIIHPTRAELEEQRRELLDALNECAGDLACYESSAPKYPAKMKTLARARAAIARAEATHE